MHYRYLLLLIISFYCKNLNAQNNVVAFKISFNPDFAVDYFMPVCRKFEYEYATRIQR